MSNSEAVKAKPSLQGCRIALPVDSNDPFAPVAELADLEAALLFYPVAQILPPDSYDELDQLLRHFHDGKIEWLLLATPCAVAAVAQRLKHLDIDPSSFSQGKVALYGALTR